MADAPVATAIPFADAKFIHLVRHGQALHNVAARDHGRIAYTMEEFEDAKLDDVGEEQAKQLGARAARLLAFPRDRLESVELCREAYGKHPCDRRRPMSVVKVEFPHVDFSGIESDADVLFTPERESIDQVAGRCKAFLQVLRARKERNICVVSHGVFLETLLAHSGLMVHPSLGAQRFGNGEMRSAVIAGWAP